jgi:hypothetical protein
MKRHRSLALHGGAIAVLFLLQFVLPSYHHTNFTSIMVLATYGIGYNILIGYTGLLSLGHAMFFAAGLYAAGLTVHYFGIDPVSAFVLGALVALAFATAVGLIALVLAAEYAAQIPTVPVFSTAHAPPVYDWLRRQREGAVVEVPTRSPDRYLLASIVDGHPRLNGWSGFVPTMSKRVNFSLVRPNVTPEEREDWLALVRRLGARYLVVHWDGVTYRTRMTLREHEDEGAIRVLRRFVGTTVYGVRPARHIATEDQGAAVSPEVDAGRVL